MAVQTRSRGSLEYFTTVAEAYEAWLADPDIEKISWDSPDGTRQVWRPVIKGTLDWNDEIIVTNLSQNYKDAPFGSRWWYMQPLGFPIQEITSDSGFKNQFCEESTP